MLHYDFENSIGYDVCAASHAIQKALNEELREQGVTFRQWQVLACLALLGEATQADLAERLGIEGATLVGVLDRLERDGWVKRHPHPDDRRKKVIRATKRVDPVWQTMVRCAHRVREDAVRGVDPEELATTRRVLAQIVANLQAEMLTNAPANTPLTEARTR